MTVVPSGSVEHHKSDSDLDDNDQGLPLPQHDAAPKKKVKKTNFDSAEPPPLYHENSGAGQLMIDQPCSQHLHEIDGHLPGKLHFIGDDILVLEKAVESNPALSKLLQILWTKFRGQFYDLFKFGLWPDAKGPGDDIRPNTTWVGKGRDAFTVVNPYPTALFTRYLRELATHVIWASDMDTLRYVLMYAVSCRVDGHDAPILPISPLADQLLGGLEISPRDMALLRYKYSQEHGIKLHANIKLLCDEIKKHVKSHPPRDELERSLFLLTSTDIRVVFQTLDGLWDVTTKHKLYQSTKWYYEKWDEQKLNQWPRVKQRDSRTLWEHLQHTVIRSRVDQSVRQALEQIDGAYLYDVCQEHCPLTAQCLNDIKAGEEGGPTQSQLDVIRGIVRPRYGLHLEADAWRIPDDEHVPPIAKGPRKKATSDALTGPFDRASAATSGSSRRETTSRVVGSWGDGDGRPAAEPTPQHLDRGSSNIIDDSDDYDIENASQRSGTLA